ncbi:hypothetical protein [Natrinema longum]|uniref:Uncharacterized protein n=1 Tax=Natrinema longum TaxID=370324 RepID=A0A8A2U3S6_9EURY|nr:hypothetical protein [Natrinema longum]MBZ6494973.1 hypothetical protein [Natrinema longum]QSW83731.1 hypothetical protein J0X27_09570 [Natrinema longum]
MSAAKRLYNRTDEWLLDRSQGEYAICLGVSVGVGVLVVGLLLGGKFLLVQALTMALVMFGLEYVFGLHQPTEEG